MTLKRKEDTITKEEVLNRLSEYDVYRYECPEFTIGRPFLNFMRGEKDPSLMVFLGQDGRLHHHDHGDNSYRGDCWDLVCQKYGITLPEAIKHVAKTFMLIDGPVDGYKAITGTYSKPLMIPQRHSLIHVTTKKWTPEAMGYWESYSITKEQLREEQVYQVATWSLNRRKQYIGENELCMCYKYTNGYKMYYPTRTKGADKWISNISTQLVENTQVIKNNDVIVITKAKKCRMYLSHLIPGCISVQNETRSGFSEELIEQLKGKQVYVQFDSDPAGKKHSMKLTKELGYKHLNVPDKLLQEGIKDYSDWYRARG